MPDMEGIVFVHGAVAASRAKTGDAATHHARLAGLLALLEVRKHVNAFPARRTHGAPSASPHGGETQQHVSRGGYQAMWLWHGARPPSRRRAARASQGWTRGT